MAGGYDCGQFTDFISHAAFCFALFYLRGVAPSTVPTSAIYSGAAPFVVLQLLALVALWFFPAVATWLPKQIYG